MLKPSRRPNVAENQVLDPVHHRVDRLRRPPGLRKKSLCRSEPQQQFPSHSTALRRHRWCAHFHQAGGDRSSYRVLPLRLSHRITHSCSWSRPSCTHRLPGPGRQTLTLIWAILIQSVPRLSCSHSSLVSDVASVVPVVPVDSVLVDVVD